jgi:sensor histidine kinase YesM
MLYCSAYGAPFIVMAGMFNQYLVRWSNKQPLLLKHRHLTSVFQLFFAIFIAVFFSIFAFFMFDPNPHETFSDTFYETYFQISIIADTMVNCFILMLAKFIDQEEVVKRQEQHIKEIESEILRVKYQQLRAQVNPHFLFNSLNILISLINSNPNKATEYTKQLASIYRYLLSNDKQDVVLFSEELKLAQQYAKILNIRYGDGIKFHIPEITDATVKGMRIVPTALQILIENAVKHHNNKGQLGKIPGIRTEVNLILFPCQRQYFNRSTFRCKEQDAQTNQTTTNKHETLDYIHPDNTFHTSQEG